MGRAQRKRPNVRHRRQPRTNEYVRAAASLGKVQSQVSLVGAIVFVVILVMIGLAMLIGGSETAVRLFGGALIGFGALILVLSLVNHWAVKSNREYAALYGATGAAMGVRQALIGPMLKSSPRQLMPLMRRM